MSSDIPGIDEETLRKLEAELMRHEAELRETTADPEAFRAARERYNARVKEIFAQRKNGAGR